MKTVELASPSWRLIRIALSLSLLKGEPVVIKNCFEYIERNYDIIPLFDTLKQVVLETGAGVLGDMDGDVVFNPDGINPGSFIFDTGGYSPISEVELFLLPSLLFKAHRSVINYTGVTHSHISYPTTFLKETLLGLLEGFGFYASMNLKRFGFYGSGGGSAESRIYPAEPAKSTTPLSFAGASIDGAKVFMAKMNMEMASREKEFIVRNTGVPENRVQIMEIVDADGFGNSIQIYVKCGGVNVILSRDMEIYNSAGDFIFDEGRYYSALSELIGETDKLLKLNAAPQNLIEEVLPYLILSGSDIPESIKSTECYRICMEIL